ncbi:MAG TPA: hypothetical protein DCE23_02100 [Firmicutes bacterium]|nr:hypothetical protein [Bacillota bacterium]
MFNRYSKKMIAVFALFILFFILASEVFASYAFTLYNEGDTVMEYSSSKLEGNVYVRADYSPQYYNGELVFSLQKKGLFGYSNVGSRQKKSTYGKVTEIAYWQSNSKTEYRGFLELAKADSPTKWSCMTGHLSVGQNNHA